MSSEQLKEYREQRKYFGFGSTEHMKKDCPKVVKKDEVLPSSNAVPDVQGNTQKDVQARYLFKSWGKLQDKNALFLFDPSSTDNFISLEMAQALELHQEQMGITSVAESAFMGAEMHVTHVVGKLRIQIGDYSDYEELLVLFL